MTAQIPKSLRKPKETVASLLGKSTARDQFRLDAVTSEFCEPLEELLGAQECFLSDTVTSLDCLALGYLALMQAPDLPHDWLKRALKEKFPRLGTWTTKFARSTFGESVTPAYALAPPSQVRGKGKPSLPWQVPPSPTMAGLAASILETTLDALPIVGQLRVNRQMKKSSEDATLEDYERKQLAVMATNRNRELYSQIVAATVGMSTFVGYLFWVGILQLPRRRSNENGKRDFGAAGAMLGLG